VVGVFATNHQPQVLPPYFPARKKNPGPGPTNTPEMQLAFQEWCGHINWS
jgi:hypothetical protein